MNPPSSGPRCPSCSSPLEHDGFCLACLFREAAEVAPGEPHSTPATEPGYATVGSMLLPRTFAHHRLIRELGSGGMGIVYEAQDLRLKRTVALKLIRSAAFARPEEIMRFKTEAETVARLDHPNIVPVIDVGESEGHPFFTMKLVPGTTLAANLKGGPMPPKAAAVMMKKLAAAVQHAHDRGVLHRDLKPGNVLIDQAGEPVLTDFGLARMADMDSALTLSTARLGTPQYMSPEQVRGGTRDVTTASDVWALGIMLYQMLTGRVPFDGANHQEIFRQVLEKEPESLTISHSDPQSTVRTRTDRDLETLCLRCLQKEPSGRIPSAHELALELDRWLHGKPIHSRRVTNSERAWKWMKRNPWRVTALALIAFLVLGGSITSLILWRLAERARGDADLTAAAARSARDAMVEEVYFSNIASALGSRTRGDFAGARALLARTPETMRGFEWRLLHGMCRGDQLWTAHPPGHVETLAWDARRGRLVTLDRDRRFHFLDPKTGESSPGPVIPLRPAEASGNGFTSLTISPDGRYWACGDGDYVLAGEMESGRIFHATPSRRSRPSLAWLDADRLLIGVLPSKGEPLPPDAPLASVYRMTSGETNRLPNGSHGPVAVSADGRFAAWIVGADVEIRTAAALDAPPLATLSSFKMGSDAGLARHLAFSGDGKFLAVDWAFQTSVLRVYALPEGNAFTNQPYPPLAVLAISPDQPLMTFGGLSDWLNTVLFTRPVPEGLAWDDDDNQSPESYDLGGPYQPPPRFLTRTAQQGRFHLLLGNESRSVALAIPSGLDSVFSLTADGAVRRFPITAKSSEDRKAGVSSTWLWDHPSASPNGHHILYKGANDGMCRVWHRTQRSRTKFPKDLCGLAVLNDGRALTLDTASKTIVLWQTKGGFPPEELWRIPSPPEPAVRHFARAAVSRDEHLVAALFDGMFLTVDLTTRKVSASRELTTQRSDLGSQSIDVSPDGRWLAVTGLEGERALLFDASRLDAPPRVAGPASRRSGVDTVAVFNADGSQLFAGNDDGFIRVFDTASGHELTDASWEAGALPVSAMALSRDGKILAACTGDTVLYDAASADREHRRERLRLTIRMQRNWIQFAGQDNLFLHCGPWRPLEVWETSD